MADINLTIKIPDAHVSRVAQALNQNTDSVIKIGMGDGANVKFTYAAKQAEETQVQFAQRFIRQYVRAFIQCHELNIDNNRYKGEIDNIDQPMADVPEGILE